MPNMTESEVFDKFAQIVAKSLRIDASQIAPDTHLTDLGAESLDLIEITMETETQFHIFLPDKSVLETAVEVFGPGILEKDGYLTEEGKRFLLRRMPGADAQSLDGKLLLKSYGGLFMRWRGNRWIEIEEETLSAQIQTWLHLALRYIKKRN